jgi:subfamily B ATP-binding cassette protein HlyB/CyaB
VFITHNLPKQLKIDAVVQLHRDGGHQLQAVQASPGDLMGEA